MNEPGTHKLTEALEGQAPAAGAGAEAGPNQPTNQTHDDIAEQTRREQQSRSDGLEDRDARLVRVGRGQQTHG